MRLSAMRSCTTPCSASGLPNGVRICARMHISSSAFSARPIARMQWWMRPGPSRACAIANPPPSSPSRFAAGQPHVLEQRLAVAAAGVVAEDRQRAHDLHAGRVERHEDHRVAVVRVGVGVRHAHEDRELAAADAAPLVHHLCALTT